jgi:threonine 3-dehydrogenase
VLKSNTIKGVYGREIFETWYEMLAMLQNGLDVSAVITHHSGWMASKQILRQ